MRRPAIAFLLIVIITVLLAGPIYEALDRSGQISETGDESLIFLATCLGTMFITMRVAAVSLRLPSKRNLQDAAIQFNRNPAFLSFRLFGLDALVDLSRFPLRI